MPNTYYWQGSTTGAGIARYDWNYGPNWKVANWGKPFTLWATSATAPGASDAVYVGDYFVAKSPILYGGYSGSVASGNWLNVGTTGTTFNSSLNSITIKMLTPAGLTNHYPFPWLGGGITGDIYNWAVNTQGLDSATITGVTGARANLGLTLKVAYGTYIYTTGTINPNFGVGGVDANGYPNYSVVNLNFVRSANYNNGGTAATYSILQVGGGGDGIGTPLSTKSPSSVGLGNIAINGGAFQSVSIDNGLAVGMTAVGGSGSVARAGNVSFTNSVVAAAACHNGDINVDKSCTFGTFTVRSGSIPYYQPIEMGKFGVGYDGRQINLAGTFNTQTANTLLGWATSVTSSPFVSGVYLYDQYTTLPGTDGYDYVPTILIGNPADGGTFAAQTVAVFNEVAPYSSTTSGNSQRPWRIEFFGDANITSMSTEGTTIAAWKSLDPSKQITINKLTLAEQSTLDLNYAPQFDNWFFGTLTGGSVAGGINFNDGTCTVVGSAGVRLYNTKVVNSFDFRAGATVPVVYSNLDVSPADTQIGSSEA